ncbi:MAG: phosphoribosylanthranilate isomerase [Planctomycetia bacterium]|nr:phosphoribosylanthranilate isomerase [Planctomycetia bacterium]
MRNMMVKICGVTTEDDAKMVGRFPIHAVGFVFYPASKRFVCPEMAKTFVQIIRDESEGKISCVGVFVDETGERMREIIRYADLDAVQLHGNESVEAVRTLRREGNKVIRRVHPENLVTAEKQYAEFLDAKHNEFWFSSRFNLRRMPADVGARKNLEWNSDECEKPRSFSGQKTQKWPDFTFLTEISGGKMPGGEGVSWEWEVLECLPEVRVPVILAGGVTPENVLKVKNMKNVMGVDVSSGVESGPGRKSEEKIKLLLERLYG